MVTFLSNGNRKFSVTTVDSVSMTPIQFQQSNQIIFSGFAQNKPIYPANTRSQLPIAPPWPEKGKVHRVTISDVIPRVTYRRTNKLWKQVSELTTDISMIILLSDQIHYPGTTILSNKYDLSTDYKGLLYIINRSLMVTLSKYINGSLPVEVQLDERVSVATGARNSHPFGTVLSQPWLLSQLPQLWRGAACVVNHEQDALVVLVAEVALLSLELFWHFKKVSD